MTYTRSGAPVDLEPLETFCNSARMLYGEDAFTDPAAAAGWLREHGLAGESLELDQRGLDQLVHVRETIRAHLGGEAPAETSATLNSYAELVLSSPGWDQRGRPVLRPATEDGTGGLLGHLLAVLFNAGLKGDLERLKPCRAADCRWVFYDRSPARNSIWCSMEICGARHKMRAYRSRRSSR